MGRACRTGVHEESCAGCCDECVCGNGRARVVSICEEQGEFEKQGKPQGRDDGYKPWTYDEEEEGRL